MNRDKLLTIAAAALIATSMSVFSLSLHNAGVAENQKNEIIQETGAREEFEAFKENLKIELRNAYINKEISERRLNSESLKVERLNFEEFMRREKPLSPEEQAEYEAINNFMAANFFGGLGVTFGSATLGAAILYSQGEKKKQREAVENQSAVAEEPAKG